MEPIVSVIIPNYNHGKYLDERIQSVINQTFQDLEIIILDDCSPDNSREVIEKYRNHPKVSIILYNDINSGSTFIQWNKGFTFAKGKYIWIAESDDFCEKEMLEFLVTELEKNSKNVISFCLSQFVDENGMKISPLLKTDKQICTYKSRSFITLFMADENVICNASSALFRRDLIPLISTNYKNYKAAGDRLFWIYIAEHGNVCMLNSPLNYFRQHKIKVSPKKLLDGTTFYEDYRITKYLQLKGYISKCRMFFIKNHYINNVNKVINMPINVRTDIYKLWNVPLSVPNRVITYIDYLYNYAHRLIMKCYKLYYTKQIKR